MDEARGQSVGMTLTASDWFHEGVLLDKNLLAIDQPISTSSEAAMIGLFKAEVIQRWLRKSAQWGGVEFLPDGGQDGRGSGVPMSERQHRNHLPAF